MTSISSTSYQYQSPLTMLQNELTSEVSNGTISSSDESALSSALTDINNALQSDTSSSPPSPTDMKTKIDDLIAQEVQNGKLTSDQATELQSLFANAFQGGPGGSGGPGGPGGAGGPPPGGPGGPAGGASDSQSSSSSDSDSSSSSTSTSSTDSSSSSDSSSGSSAINLLQDFLQLLRDSTTITANYGANGQTTSVNSASIVNYQS
jgi:hypothetical protein